MATHDLTTNLVQESETQDAGIEKWMDAVLDNYFQRFSWKTSQAFSKSAGSWLMFMAHGESSWLPILFFAVTRTTYWCLVGMEVIGIMFVVGAAGFTFWMAACYLLQILLPPEAQELFKIQNLVEHLVLRVVQIFSFCWVVRKANPCTGPLLSLQRKLDHLPRAVLRNIAHFALILIASAYCGVFATGFILEFVHAILPVASVVWYSVVWYIVSGGRYIIHAIQIIDKRTSMPMYILLPLTLMILLFIMALCLRIRIFYRLNLDSNILGNKDIRNCFMC